MKKQIQIGTKFTTVHKGMSVTSSYTNVYETWEVVEIFETGYRCELRSSDAVMEVNQSYGRLFDEQTIINALNS